MRSRMSLANRSGVSTDAEVMRANALSAGPNDGDDEPIGRYSSCRETTGTTALAVTNAASSALGTDIAPLSSMGQNDASQRQLHIRASVRRSHPGAGRLR